MPRLIAPMPVVILNYGCVAKFEAIDPTTGVAVSGVTITNPALYGVNLSQTGEAQTVADLESPILLRTVT